MSNIVRKVKVWADDEDKVLKSLREDFGPSTWQQVSLKLFEILRVSRSAKQCRDRYFSHLVESGETLTWLNSEIDEVFEQFFEHGAKWSIIAKNIKTKNEIQIKNLFYSTIRRNIRKFNKGKLENERITLKSLSILENEEICEILTTTKKVRKNYFSNKYLTRTAVQVIAEQLSGRVDKKKVENTNKIFKNYYRASTQLQYEDVILRLDEIEPIPFY